MIAGQVESRGRPRQHAQPSVARQLKAAFTSRRAASARSAPAWRSAPRIRPGDRSLASGPVGDHGTAVLLARHEFGLQGDLRSDSASVLPFTQAALAGGGVRFMRDPTRGGIATIADEISLETGFGVVLDEAGLPVSEPVRRVCEMLGY